MRRNAQPSGRIKVKRHPMATKEVTDQTGRETFKVPRAAHQQDRPTFCILETDSGIPILASFMSINCLKLTQ